MFNDKRINKLYNLKINFIFEADQVIVVVSKT